MLVLKCKIEIDCKDKESGAKKQKISFDYVSSVVVKTSCKSLGDTASVVVPRKMLEKAGNPFGNFLNRDGKRKSIGDSVGRGDEITIQLGYDKFGLHTVFKGYITHIEWGQQLTIKCEDKTFLLRNKVAMTDENGKSIIYVPFDVKKFLEKNNLKDITVANEEKYVFGDMNIEGHLRVDQVLDKVTSAYPYIRIFFRYDNYKDGKKVEEASEKLYITRSTEPISAEKKPTVFSPERNIIDDSKLTYINIDDLKLIITAEVVAHCNDVEFTDEKKENSKVEEQKNNPAEELKDNNTEQEQKKPAYKKLTADYPAKIAENNKNGYEQRVYFHPESIDEAKAEQNIEKGEPVKEEYVVTKLREYAQGRYELFATDRVNGSFTAFGEPFVLKGDSVKFDYGDFRPELNDKEFIVDGVEYNFGSNGYRQTITLGYQAIQKPASN